MTLLFFEVQVWLRLGVRVYGEISQFWFSRVSLGVSLEVYG